MNDPNLIIYDEYINYVSTNVGINGNDLEMILDNYIAILGEIQAEAIKNGEISKALAAYKDCAVQLDGRIKEISDTLSKVTKKFLVSVNQADDYLF